MPFVEALRQFQFRVGTEKYAESSLISTARLRSDLRLAQLRFNTRLFGTLNTWRAKNETQSSFHTRPQGFRARARFGESSACPLTVSFCAKI